MKSKNYNREQELKKELREIYNEKQIEINKKIYPEIVKRYLGNFFKVKNSYGADRNWWLYTKVTKIDLKDLYNIANGEVSAHISVLRFEVDCDGKIFIMPDRTYLHSLGAEITEKEFNSEWNKMVDKINAY